MFYTAGKAAKILGVAASTLRYYDREGLLPFIEKTSNGIRMFTEEDLTGIRIIQCLKKTGLPLKEIRRFMSLPPDGEETIQSRLAILLRQRQILEEKQKELEEMMHMVDYKIWYYTTSRDAGTTKKAAALAAASHMPDAVRPGYDALHTFPSANTSR